MKERGRKRGSDPAGLHDTYGRRCGRPVEGAPDACQEVGSISKMRFAILNTGLASTNRTDNRHCQGTRQQVVVAGAVAGLVSR